MEFSLLWAKSLGTKSLVTIALSLFCMFTQEIIQHKHMYCLKLFQCSFSRYLLWTYKTVNTTSHRPTVLTSWNFIHAANMLVIFSSKYNIFWDKFRYFINTGCAWDFIKTYRIPKGTPSPWPWLNSPKSSISYVRYSFLLVWNSNFVFKTVTTYYLSLRYQTSKMAWPWNPGQRSLKVIESGTIL